MSTGNWKRAGAMAPARGATGRKAEEPTTAVRKTMARQTDFIVIRRKEGRDLHDQHSNVALVSV
jgi:hypothetical protein